MRQLLLSMMAITLVSLMVMGGAFSAFSDTETITGNSIIVGTGEKVMDYEGLTPGFWKNNIDLWVGYSSNELIGKVFDIPEGLIELADDSLLEALNYYGGDETIGMARNLLRQAVAALLNASHPEVDYPITAADIIDAANNALATLDRSEIETPKEKLAMNNDLGGGIDAHGNPIG